MAADIHNLQFTMIRYSIAHMTKNKNDYKKITDYG